MNSWRNSHQRHNFLRAEASRDMLKFRVSEMAFPGVFQKVFCTTDATIVSSEYTQDWKQCR